MARTVTTVINKFIEYPVRVVLVIYALIGLLGVMWFSNTLHVGNFVWGVLFALSSGFIGLAPLYSFQTKKHIYLIACLVGSAICLYKGIDLINSEHKSQKSIIEQFVLIGCFAFMALRMSLRKKSEDEGYRIE